MGRKKPQQQLFPSDLAPSKRRADPSSDLHTASVHLLAGPGVTEDTKWDAARAVTLRWKRGLIDDAQARDEFIALGLDALRKPQKPVPEPVGPHGVACPSCAAPAGQGCRSTSREQRGRLLGGSRTHIPRQRLVAKANAGEQPDDILQEA